MLYEKFMSRVYMTTYIYQFAKNQANSQSIGLETQVRQMLFRKQFIIIISYFYSII